MTKTIEKSVDVNVPARTAYDQCTQFEELPRILPSVKEIEQIDDARLRWKARIGGREKEWRLRICEQVPDKRIAWKAESGPWNAGCLTFHRISDDRSRVMLQLEYTPEGVVETAYDVFGLAANEIGKELSAFKLFLEDRGTATGAWRGSIPSSSEA